MCPFDIGIGLFRENSVKSFIFSDVITTQQLKERYVGYSNPLAKINRDVKQGKLFPLVKGVYETNLNVNGYLLAGFIYGPSEYRRYFLLIGIVTDVMSMLSSYS